MRSPRAFIPLLLALTIQSVVTTQEPQRESGSVDVYEAVVRYQIKSWDLAASSYCVSVEGRDATKDFLKRFNPLLVKSASSCRKQTKQKVSMQVVDKKTGKPSVIFDVEAIHWLSQNEADVEGGYLCGSLCMAGGKYHVIRDGIQWVVTRYDVHIQS
jgi:hypothetical protein